MCLHFHLCHNLIFSSKTCFHVNAFFFLLNVVSSFLQNCFGHMLTVCWPKVGPGFQQWTQNVPKCALTPISRRMLLCSVAASHVEAILVQWQFHALKSPKLQAAQNPTTRDLTPQANVLRCRQPSPYTTVSGGGMSVGGVAHQWGVVHHGGDIFHGGWNIPGGVWIWSLLGWWPAGGWHPWGQVKPKGLFLAKPLELQYNITPFLKAAK